MSKNANRTAHQLETMLLVGLLTVMHWWSS